MMRWICPVVISLMLVACGKDPSDEATKPEPQTMAGSKADSTDACRMDNGGCGDPARNRCLDSDEGKPKCEGIEPCQKDNGGCGDAKFVTCSGEPGEEPVCTDIHECDNDNGGCGDSKYVSCEDVDGAAPRCVDIDECEKDNGGCGDPKLMSCQNRMANKPECFDVDECKSDNGGCGDPELIRCVNHDGAAPSCEKRVAHASAGDYHACAVTEDGALYCWGENMYGQRGAGALAEPARAPVRIREDLTFRAVDAGGYQTCAITKQGELYCWGDNFSGQLGLGSTEQLVANPTQVGADMDWEAVSVGYTHACGIRQGGQLYCWGSNATGELGDGATEDRSTPALISSTAGFSAVACADRVSCGLKMGELYCWGNDLSGQIGAADSASMVRAPTRVGDAKDWSALSLDKGLTCGIRGGALFCWGTGLFNLQDAESASASAPMQIGDAKDWETVAVSEASLCGVRAGALYCLGNNMLGQLGLGDAEHALVPERVGAGTKWSTVVGGYDMTCGVQSDALYCWGSNELGKLGIDSTESTQTTPAQVLFRP